MEILTSYFTTFVAVNNSQDLLQQGQLPSHTSNF